MQTKLVLIVDDEPDIRELLEITLGRMGLSTRSAQDLASARTLLTEIDFDLCLTDMHLPDGNGIELVKHIGQYHQKVPVAMITAHGSMDTAIESLKSGAFDFLQKPLEIDHLRSIVTSALKLKEKQQPPDATRLLGNSPIMQEHRAQILKLARSQAPIYISGESGTGKELAARLIHESGSRSDAPFVPVNCGAIPSELMESEFFGHLKGSFTGASSDKDGLFQAAQGGTLFLDEVADLPLAMQVKLLRAIQEKAIRPVGSHSEIPIDVRILCATHKNLAEEVERGSFRQDLYYRLNVIELRVPSLRQRISDIPLLAEEILSRLATAYKEPKPALSAAAIAKLQSHHWPGNVRELENCLERAFTLCEKAIIDDNNLDLGSRLIEDQKSAPVPPKSGTAEPSIQDQEASTVVSVDITEASMVAGIQLPVGSSLDEYLADIERRLITQALEANRWNKTAAARQLGITFRALRYKLQKLNLE